MSPYDTCCVNVYSGRAKKTMMGTGHWDGQYIITFHSPGSHWQVSKQPSLASHIQTIQCRATSNCWEADDQCDDQNLREKVFHSRAVVNASYLADDIPLLLPYCPLSQPPHIWVKGSISPSFIPDLSAPKWKNLCCVVTYFRVMAWHWWMSYSPHNGFWYIAIAVESEDNEMRGDCEDWNVWLGRRQTNYNSTEITST